jgi:hypothetical protein
MKIAAPTAGAARHKNSMSTSQRIIHLSMLTSFSSGPDLQQL